MKKNLLLFFAWLMAVVTMAQKDWSQVNFSDDYKVNVKLSSSFAKGAAEGNTFIANYQLHQATVMKGSESSATKAVFAEMSISGLDTESYQELADRMYQELITELDKAGIKVVNGDALLQSKNVQKKIDKADEDDIMGNSGNNPSYEGKRKISEGSMPGYGAWAVLKDVSFPVRNINYLYSAGYMNIPFYYGLATKEQMNFITVDFYISFANFEGGRGYKNISIKGDPVIGVNMVVGIYDGKGSKNYYLYKKTPVWGTTDWALSVEKTKENDGSAFGLSSSADFQVSADKDKYMQETESIISNMQKDFVKNIKSEL